MSKKMIDKMEHKYVHKDSVKKSNHDSEDDNKEYGYQDKQYWALPENVRHAIDAAKKKSKHTDFYNRLKGLNDKITIYKILFYSR